MKLQLLGRFFSAWVPLSTIGLLNYIIEDDKYKGPIETAAATTTPTTTDA